MRTEVKTKQLTVLIWGMLSHLVSSDKNKVQRPTLFLSCYFKCQWFSPVKTLFPFITSFLTTRRNLELPKSLREFQERRRDKGPQCEWSSGMLRSSALKHSPQTPPWFEKSTVARCIWSKSNSEAAFFLIELNSKARCVLHAPVCRINLQINIRVPLFYLIICWCMATLTDTLIHSFLNQLAFLHFKYKVITWCWWFKHPCWQQLQQHKSKSEVSTLLNSGSHFFFIHIPSTSYFFCKY